MYNLDIIIKLLENKWFLIEEGLSETNIKEIEQIFLINFPPDYRTILKHFVPIWWSFVNWKNIDVEYISSMLNWPINWILFDVEYNNYWYNWWWIKPIDIAERKSICKKYLQNVVKLIPLYSHRYIPSVNKENLPIISIYQTDIIIYSNNIYEWFEIEFWNKTSKLVNSEYISFWSDLVY